MSEFELKVRAPRGAVGAADHETLPGVRVVDQGVVELDEGLLDARFVDPVSVILVGVAAAIIHRLVRAWENQRERGAILDLRTKPPLVDYLAAVPFGTLIVVDADGTTQVHTLGGSSAEEFQNIVQAAIQPFLPG